MWTLEGGSIDCTVTSPPYDNLREYNGALVWNEEIWKGIIQELYRVTKPGGTVVWVVGDATVKGSETGTSFKQALWAKECGFNLHDTMIWEKNSSSFPAKTTDSRYSQIFEYMFVWTKGAPKTANLIVDKPNVEAGKNYGYRKAWGKDYIVPDFSVRNNIFKFTTSLASSKIHPAMFPEQLVNDHLLTWTNEGDTVLDPFMGSGTTGIVAYRLKRNFIGIEVDETYFTTANHRIQDETKQEMQSVRLWEVT